jgi:protein O-mannosyl-transferase
VRQRQPVTPARVVGAHPVFPILLIVAAGAATYWNSLSGPFIWDDQVSIVTNRTIQHLWPISDTLSPPRETPVAGRPIVNLSFAINYAIGGLSEAGYHAGNIAVHIGCALLLFSIVRRTLAGLQLRSADSTALVAALLWMLHPLQSEAVDYVTQRSESLMALFFLLTLYCAIRARRNHRTWDPPSGGAVRLKPALSARPSTPHGTTRGQAGSGRAVEGPDATYDGRWQTLSVIACACGMASKESMAVAPLIVVLYDRAFEFTSIREALQARKYLYAGLAATWIELGAFIWQQPRSTAGLFTAVDPWSYLLNQIQMLVLYLRLSVWPDALILDYGLPRALAIRDVVPTALVVVLLIIASVVALARWPRIGFLAAAFWLTLAPTSSVIPIASEVGAERRMYLPFAALAVLAAVAGRWLVDRAVARSVGLPKAEAFGGSGKPALNARPSTPTRPTRGQAGSGRAVEGPDPTYTSSNNGRTYARAAAGLTTIVLTALTVRTVYRNAEYSKPLSLWGTVVERRPHGRARMALATELIAAGDHAAALPHLREAVRDFPDARYALGTELVFGGQIDEGIAQLRQFVQARPEYPNRIPARTLLSQALESQGKFTEAADELRTVLKMAPTSDKVHTLLADVLIAAGKYDEAAAEYRGLVASRPEDASLESKLAAALLAAGRLNEATEHFQKALRLDPRSAVLNRSLAEVYVRQGAPARAEPYAREALRLEPGNPAAHNLLGITLASTGSLGEAIAEFQQALQISPGDPQARANLERALRGTTARR